MTPFFDLMSPDDAWSKLGGNYLAEQMQALTAYEPFAYEGLHPEGVHQMRVAIRRMRAVFRAFRGVLGEDPQLFLPARLHLPGRSRPAAQRSHGHL